MDSTLPEIVEFYSLIKTMRKAGAVLILQDILNYLIKKTYEKEKENLLKNWYTSGLWYGKFLQTKFNNPLEIFKKILTTSFLEITEIEILTKNNKTSIRVIAPNQPQENTELLLKFIGGVMNSLNYKVLKEENWKGIILLETEKRKELPKMELEEM